MICEGCKSLTGTPDGLFHCSNPLGDIQAGFSGGKCEFYNANAKEQYDPVNKPEHYANTKVECIDAMEQTFGVEAVKSFALLNCYKYLWCRKDKENEEQDIKKALWYFDRFKELVNR